MAIFTYKGKSAYIDDRLANELDTKVIPDVVEKDSDMVFCIDGGEGTGKSKLSDIICGYYAFKVLQVYKIDVDYSVDNVHLSPSKFRDGIINAKKNEVVVYDEAHKGMGSRRSLSEINNILNDLMMEMRQKNLFVILILPTFFMLDKYPAIFRTKGLFHVYRGVNKRTKKKERGYWVYFNEKYKLHLYIKGKQYFNYNCIKWSNFRGRFYNQYIMDEVEYRAKKKESFKQHGKRETKAEKWLDERNKMIYLIHNELKIGARNIKRLLSKVNLKLSETIIKKIIVEQELSKETTKTDNFDGEDVDFDELDDKEDPESDENASKVP